MSWNIKVNVSYLHCVKCSWNCCGILPVKTKLLKHCFPLQIHFYVISHAKTIRDIIVRADIPLDRAFLCCQACHVFPKTPKFSRLNTEISLHSTEIQLNGTKVAQGFGEPELSYIYHLVLKRLSTLEKRQHWIYT